MNGKDYDDFCKEISELEDNQPDMTQQIGLLLCRIVLKLLWAILRSVSHS